jgi:hypothetical protein
MTNEETDTALLLENELKRRVREVVRAELALTVGDLVKKEIEKNKQAMMTEITITIGKSLQLIEKEGRKPLWETDLTEFGLTKEQLNSHMIEGSLNAIREQT